MPGEKRRSYTEVSATSNEIDPTGELKRERFHREQQQKRYSQSLDYFLKEIETAPVYMVEEDPKPQETHIDDYFQKEEVIKDSELDEFLSPRGEEDPELQRRIQQESKSRKMKETIYKQCYFFIYYTMFKEQRRVQNVSSCQNLSFKLSNAYFSRYKKHNIRKGIDPHFFILTKEVGENINSFITQWFEGKLGDRKGKGSLLCYPEGSVCELAIDQEQDDIVADETYVEEEENFFF
ncbi:hypothetical protein ADUPG1_007698 [Aduncisulcus paluster]|uniref:Uncharacterized protein n=1 Tax=Aduncisulcus paluster TaxID=2918883 RepID=A0ABQ5KSB3_9EUKA|nr:hypothetical protein ADUPG1_007698 [Aduncisulcus paluster]